MQPVAGLLLDVGRVVAAGGLGAQPGQLGLGGLRSGPRSWSIWRALGDVLAHRVGQARARWHRPRRPAPRARLVNRARRRLGRGGCGRAAAGPGRWLRAGHQSAGGPPREGAGARVAAASSSSSSMRSSWLYLATRSRAGRRAGLDLAAVRGDREVGDGGVLGLAGPVADHAAEAVAVGERHGVERLGQRADLVDLDQQRVGATARRCRGASRSGLVTNRSSPTICTRSPSSCGERAPALPVVLVQRVLDRDDRVGVEPVRRSSRSSTRRPAAPPSNR